MHVLDRLGAAVFLFDRRRTRAFPEGWGDRLTIELLAHPLDPGDPVDPIDIVWGRKDEHRGFRTTRGTFTSPVAELLPVGARAVPVELFEPGAGTDRTVVLLPAWNDHALEPRRRLARELALAGVGSAIFDIPLYGARRSTTGNEQAIRTVADFAVMFHGAVREARALVHVLAERSHVGITGFGLGGTLAAHASAVVRLPVAVAPLAAAAGPGPFFLDGLTSRAVDWKALGGSAAREELRAVLSGASVLDRAPLPHHASAVLVAGDTDGVVPPRATEELSAHWQGSEMRRVGAGHGTLRSRHRHLLVEAVVRSLERTFEAAPPTGG